MVYLNITKFSIFIHFFEKEPKHLRVEIPMNCMRRVLSLKYGKRLIKDIFFMSLFSLGVYFPPLRSFLHFSHVFFWGGHSLNST